MKEIKLRDYQQKAVNEIEDAFKRHQNVLFVLATAGGKCLGIDTPVLMYDGTVKMVQDVVVGDQLMGPDSKPRNVLSLARGSEELYIVTPKKGDSYVVNKSHILSLRNHDGDIVNTPVTDYIMWPRWKKSIYDGWRVPCVMSGDTSYQLDPIVVDYYGFGDYYGFTIDGDHLFMLGDFTVTHNTFTFSYIARQHGANSETVMIMAHRSELISQASLSLASIGVRHQVIAPKPLVSKIKMLHLEKLSEIYVDPFSHVSVGSVQTIGRRLDKLNKPDLLIVDESHHSTAGLWKNVIDHFDTRCLGVTATPIRSDGHGLGRVFSTMVVGKSMRDLIADGNLSSYVVYSTPEDINYDEIKRIQSGESKGDYNARDLEKQMDKPKIVGRAVEHYEKYAKGKSALVFAVSIAHSDHIADEFCRAGYKFVSISGKTDDSLRYKAVDDLRNKRIDGIVNCDLFGEGTDITGVEVVIMMRPISELAFSLFSQQVGRGLRLSEGKDQAVILDMVGNFQRHGFPEDKTDWTLDDREKRSSNKNDHDSIKIKTCPNCFATHRPAPSCLMCGYEYPVIAAREYEQVEGDLIELERQREIDSRRKDQNQLMREAQTAADLASIDAKLGLARGATAHKKAAIEEKRKAMATLNKAIKHYKENVAWGDPVVFDAILTSAFGVTEQEAKKYGATRANRLIENMREFLELRNSQIERPYSNMNFQYTIDAIRGDSLGF